MSVQQAQPAETDGLKIWSCTNCRRRKVRCDRHYPCIPCSKSKAECIFPVSGRIIRRSNDSRVFYPPSQKQSDVLGRLRKLEAMIGDLGSQVENAEVPGQSGVKQPVTMMEAMDVTSSSANEKRSQDQPLHIEAQSSSGLSSEPHGGLHNGSWGVRRTPESSQNSQEPSEVTLDSKGDLFVGKRFWTVFCKEVEHIFEAVGGPNQFDLDSDSSVASTSTGQRHVGYYNFLLSNVSASNLTQALHPLPSQLLFLWQVYSENVDPLVKVLHGPTIEKIVRELRGSYNSLGNSVQALLLVISFAAITSLSEEEVRVNFNTEREQLLVGYRSGAEQAFSRANLFDSPDVTILQAYIIYLTILQHSGEGKHVWFLAGTLVRIAIGLKLHREPSRSECDSIFEREMRRRLWWQICLVDSQPSGTQDAEYGLSERIFDTPMPTNTDDININPSISGPPVEVLGWTGLSPFLIQCEVWRLSTRLRAIKLSNSPGSSESRESQKVLHQCRQRFEDVYLKEINPSNSLHCFTATYARLCLSVVELILYFRHSTTKPGDAASPPPSQATQTFSLALSIVEDTYSLENEPTWARWTWQIRNRQPPWYALRIVLSQLSSVAWGPGSHRAWAAAQRSLDSLPEPEQRNPKYQQLLNSVSEVRRKHPSTLQGTALGSLSPVPSGSTVAPDMSGNQGGVAEPASTWTPQEPFLNIADASTNDYTSFEPSLGFEMDWQEYEEIAELNFDFWNVGGI